ncbi:DUF393 domain-containing protein [Pseudomonas sp. 2FG]|uniref:thiol-disulfide oxidoreductase DCC family protein n=1 Tax=Pseudomonas sp. 2FG TaxID=2502191 RepID=UPI0010F647CB|nr:DUF393 domain-containing protein [Pseudomonas sp. 2FG]
MRDPAKPKVYYNSACPVCRAGINAQRKRMESCGITDIEWVDVHHNPEAVKEVGASLEEVRERLYLKDEAGHINIGTEAFAELWAKTPKQRWLGHMVRLPVIRPSVAFAYKVFARLLYRWNRRLGHW